MGGEGAAEIMDVIESSRLVRYFLYATLVNFCAAVIFTVPVIVPEFIFPLKLTIWPGSWMFEAYFAFLIVGVLGNLGWAAFVDLSRRSLQKEYVSRYLAFSHLVLSNVAVYGVSTFMFMVGYNGGTAALLGFGKAIITQSIIGWMVVPIGVFIYIYIIASVLGVGNVAWMLRSPQLGMEGQLSKDFRRRDMVFWGALIGALSIVFVLLPATEMRFYPSNTLQELTMQAVAGVGLIIAATLEAYAYLRHSRPMLDSTPKI